MARRKSITTTSKATTVAWMQFRRASCSQSLPTLRSGTPKDENEPPNMNACCQLPIVGSALLTSPRGRRPSITCTSFAQRSRRTDGSPEEEGVGTAIHYPIPLHLQKAYAALNYQVGDFPTPRKSLGNCFSSDVPSTQAGTAGASGREDPKQYGNRCVRDVQHRYTSDLPGESYESTTGPISYSLLLPPAAAKD